jgi:diadenosine tetraphosphate (Ap4A) HIT family hydrolase
MSTLIHERVALANAGTNPYVIGRVASGWAVMGDVQFLEGYCLVLPDPVVPSLNDLDLTARQAFLMDMVALGDVILIVTRASRINYEILGNAEPALHAHVFPRYPWEVDELRFRPAWFYDWSAAPPFSAEKHGALRDAIREGLRARGALLET